MLGPMLHTALHRALGERPGLITEAMIDSAIAQQIPESDELDWKSRLPPRQDFKVSDIVKDIAAFANAGGGVLLFGVADVEKAAAGREDAGELDENYERTIRQACMTNIAPPVFGVEAIKIASTAEKRLAALVVPASPDGPHFVYRGEFFGAPLRVGSDTHWLREQQIEAAYRSRFEGARRGEQALQQLYDDMVAAAVDPSVGAAVFIGVARPRTRRPQAAARNVTGIANRATLLARWWLGRNYGPLEDLQIYLTRPTLDGTYLPPKSPGGHREAHAAVLDDGSVGLSWRAGAHQHEHTGKNYELHAVPTIAIEAFVGALLALVHAAAADAAAGDYEVILGIEHANTRAHQLEFHEPNAAPPAGGVHRTMTGQFRPVRATVNPSVSDEQFFSAAIDLASVTLRQVGLSERTLLHPPLTPRPDWRH